MKPVMLAEARDEARLGGKAVQLGAAIRAGLPVPPGVALPVELVQAVRRGDAAACAAVAAAVRALGGPVAVRSSAIGEDAAGSSFAGQHLTRLNVRGAREAIAAVVAVHDSAATEAACAYRRRMGLPEAPRMAVVIQRLLEAQSAGVLFTRNPLDGRDELVIEAAWGLGEAVVSGTVTPDLYRVGRDGRVLEASVAFKHVALHPDAAGGTVEVRLPPETAAARVLGERELARLHELAREGEAAYGPDLDIEWVIAGGEVFLVQCRAITRIHAAVA
ncbi:MAG: hypothetical protein KBD01_18695 [Acidobacteria bacterium]|nr:hypothetical protein [Acidobacteriota bacterium]